MAFNLKKFFAEKDYSVATYSLIGFNLVLYLSLLGAVREDVFREYALIPADAGILQMFTSSFLHTNLLHLGQNMFFLWLFGRRVEKALGSVEFFLFYIASGFAASIMHLAIVFAFMPPEARIHQAVGASGAIAGVLGVYAIRFYMHSFHIGSIRVPASIVLLAWLMTQIVLGITGLYVQVIRFPFFTLDLASIGYWAHLGGFIFGMGFAQITQLGLEAQKEFLLTDAKESFRRGTLLDVARDFEELVECDPDDPFAYAELGRTYGLLDDVEQSVAYYQKALRMYLKEQRVDLALERFREMREVWPNAVLESKLHFRMGCQLEETGAYEEAVEVLNLLALAEPRNPESEIAALRIGEIHLSRLNRPDFAIAAFRRFLKMWPDSEWRNFAEQSMSRAQERQ